jgi:hypothetical protein
MLGWYFLLKSLNAYTSERKFRASAQASTILFDPSDSAGTFSSEKHVTNPVLYLFTDKLHKQVAKFGP